MGTGKLKSGKLKAEIERGKVIGNQ